MWVKLDICIYITKDVCLFAMNSISVIAGITKRFMVRLKVQEKVDKELAGQRGEVGEGEFGRNFTQIIIKCN